MHTPKEEIAIVFIEILIGANPIYIYLEFIP